MKISPWILTFVCIVAVAFSTFCNIQFQKANRDILAYNNDLANAIWRSEFTINNQAFVLTVQANNIRQLQREKQNLVGLSIDMRNENFQLREYLKEGDMIIDQLSEKIEAYEEELGIEDFDIEIKIPSDSTDFQDQTT